MKKRNIVFDTQVVVLMGGLGTRLGLKDKPKSMADVNGKPFFNYELLLLKRFGFHKFLFLVGYKADCIEKYYGDGSAYQIEIQYSYDGLEQLGTGGAVCNAFDKLEDNFILIYGDSFMDMDYQEMLYRYYSAKFKDKLGIMTLLHNGNQYDKSNVIYQNGELLLYDKHHPREEMQHIDYGALMLSKEIFQNLNREKKIDLADILSGLSKEGKLAGQIVTKRFFEIGTPISYEEFCIYAKNRFEMPKPALFLDRDGIINEIVFHEETEQLDSPFIQEDFCYKEGIIDILKIAQKKGYYIFIVTNQPGAAKGKVSVEKLYELNTWMIQDLQQKGIIIEYVGICPHHPKGNEKSKNTFLIYDCDCRKPKETLITRIMQVYNIDVKNSYMIGDSYTDILAGQKSGLRTVLLGNFKCDICMLLQGNKPNYVIKELKELNCII